MTALTLVHPTDSKPERTFLMLKEIRRDGGTQPRAKIDLTHVKRLEEQMEDGAQLEPVVVFYDGENYWLADGFHRYLAHQNQEEDTITCLIYQGTRRDAVLYSVGANAEHKPALPRTRTDKRRAITTLLQDPEWSQWSDREIARQCKVHHSTVAKLRRHLTGYLASENQTRTFTTKHGTKSQMNTANIGKPSPENTPELTHWPTEETSNDEPVPPLPTVEINIDEILIAFTNNVDQMSPSHVEAALKAIASHSNPDHLNAVLKAIASHPNLELSWRWKDTSSPLVPGDRVRVKRGHPQEGKTGHIDYFPNSSSAIVDLDGGGRDMIGRSQLARI